MRTRLGRGRLARLAIVSGGLLALAGGIGYFARAAGNVPSGIGYSGTLRNNGVPDDGAHDFAFDLVDGGGNSVGCAQDVRSGLSVTNGRFDVANLFGGCAALDTLLGSQATLAVRITVDGQTLSPPQALTSVPYSARARTAENGAIGGTAGYLPKYSAANALGPSVLYEGGGNIGINTNNPNNALHVKGGAQIGTGSAYTDLILRTGSSVASYNGVFELTPRTVPGSGEAKFATRVATNGSAGSSTRHDLLVDGRVGIGTGAVPGATLEVGGNVRFDFWNGTQQGYLGATASTMASPGGDSDGFAVGNPGTFGNGFVSIQASIVNDGRFTVPAGTMIYFVLYDGGGQYVQGLVRPGSTASTMASSSSSFSVTSGCLSSNTSGAAGKISIGGDCSGHFVVNNRSGAVYNVNGFIHTGSR